MPNNGFIESDYKVPSTSGYMKFQEGENTFRILGSFLDKTAIRGLEYWTTDTEGKRHPNRLTEGVPVPVEELEENPQTGEMEIPKYFWAMPVWNYAEKKIQILELSQKTIINAVRNLASNAKWGNPIEYDICVTRSKENGKTTYTVMPEPKEKVAQEVIDTLAKTPINIQALFTGDDPFKPANQAEELAEEADKILNTKEAK